MCGGSTIIISNDIETTECHQNNPSNDVKYITHMQSLLAIKNDTRIKRGDMVKIIWHHLNMRP